MILNWSINLLCIANNVLHVESGIKSTVWRKSQIFKVKKKKKKKSISRVTNSPTWRRLLAAKFFTSSTMKIKKYLVTKP